MDSRKSGKKYDKILVVGESPLLEEVSTLCSSNRYEVYAKVKPPLSSALKTSKAVRKVQAIPRGVSLAVELTNVSSEQKKKNLATLDKDLPAHVPILSTSVTVTIAEQATWIKHGHRLIGFSALPTFPQSRLLEITPTVLTSTEALSKVKEFLWSLGLEISVVEDRVGMVLPRIVCMLINEATFAVMEQVASAEDIDVAMKLGTNYPHGPVEWGEKIGFNQVVAVLSALHRDIGDDRYRVAPLLRQLALTGRFWEKE